MGPGTGGGPGRRDPSGYYFLYERVDNGQGLRVEPLTQTNPMIESNIFRAVGEHVSSVFAAWADHRAARPAHGSEKSNTADARLAACALLLEIAYADGVFAAEERRHVETTIRAQFGLAPWAARRLVAEAEAARAAKTPLWHFTGAVRSYSKAQRTLLSDILQATADFDGAATTQEAYTVRKITSLLRVEPVTCSRIRLRIVASRGDFHLSKFGLYHCAFPE